MFFYNWKFIDRNNSADGEPIHDVSNDWLKIFYDDFSPEMGIHLI